MYTEVTTKSWGSRLMGAITGVLFGLLLIVGCFYGVFWNESHGLHTAQSLQQTEKALISVPDAPLNPNNNQKVIYLTGTATTSDKLTDDVFDISENAIKLERKVLMYQWQEKTSTQTERNVGGSETEHTTYNYEPTWAESLIDSKNFKELAGHENPPAKSLNSLYQTAATVTVGDFTLPPDLVNDIRGESQLQMSTFDPKKLQARLNKSVQHVNDYFYIGNSEQAPTIGDLKVYIDEVKPQTVSVIAQQYDKTLQPYLAPAGQRVSLIVMGVVSPAAMIHTAETENQMMTWIWRAVTFLGMLIGLSMLMRPVVVLADVIPLFGSIIGFGSGMIAFVGAILLWSVATAIAWFVVRPVWAVGLIVAACAIVYALLQRKKCVVVAKP
jgi:hypothetical protein